MHYAHIGYDGVNRTPVTLRRTCVCVGTRRRIVAFGELVGDEQHQGARERATLLLPQEGGPLKR
jgi:hypothetical protein